MRYRNEPAEKKDATERLGVLLVNLGTPDSPSTADVRRYLREFLSDPRVIEMPRPLWWPILHGIILRIRPKRSAAAYRTIWTEQGSPLLYLSQRLAEGLQQRLDAHSEAPAKVALAMRYGNPDIATGLETLHNAGAKRVLVLPLYPQYSATTTASVFDAVTRELQHWRRIPELRFVNQYPTEARYIDALAESLRNHWQAHGEPERLLFSFHGLPKDYADAGDPYAHQCRETAVKVVDTLELENHRWALTYQSRVGAKEWLKPYTDQTLKEWGAAGVKRVDVICPGFATDCLETLEEIAVENRDYFLNAGGEVYHYIPALNDSPAHIELLADLVQRHTAGW
ncbi:MAG TPA: ferrochelatase [Chromatiales bacterium]|nr:ferrochelatase [Chromatiales bacterium]